MVIVSLYKMKYFILLYSKPKIHSLALSTMEFCPVFPFSLFQAGFSPWCTGRRGSAGRSLREPGPGAHSSTGKILHLTPQLPLAEGNHKPKRCWHTSMYDRFIFLRVWISKLRFLNETGPQQVLCCQIHLSFWDFTSSTFLFHTSNFYLLEEMLFFFSFWKTLWLLLCSLNNTPLAKSHFGNSCQVCSTIFFFSSPLNQTCIPATVSQRNYSHWFPTCAS